jgi:hypothetical protein
MGPSANYGVYSDMTRLSAASARCSLPIDTGHAVVQPGIALQSLNPFPRSIVPAGFNERLDGLRGATLKIEATSIVPVDSDGVHGE